MKDDYIFKTYKLGNTKVFEFNFDSISSLLDYVVEAPINYRVFHEPASIKTDRYDFCKTKNFEEAVELCRYGYHENFDRFLKMQRELQGNMPTVAYRRCITNDVAGFAPDVNAYLKGKPKNMKRLVPEEENKFINMYYNCGYNCGTNENQVLYQGLIAMQIIQLLQKLGYGVNLNFFELTDCENETIYFKIKIKSSNERLNIQKCYFPICHPSFLRRILFKLLESIMDVSSYWAGGYGHTKDVDDVRKFLKIDKKIILLNNPTDLKITGNNFIEDVDRALKILNINQYLVSTADKQIIFPNSSDLKVFKKK